MKKSPYDEHYLCNSNSVPFFGGGGGGGGGGGEGEETEHFSCKMEH